MIVVFLKTKWNMNQYKPFIQLHDIHVILIISKYQKMDKE